MKITLEERLEDNLVRLTIGDQYLDLTWDEYWSLFGMFREFDDRPQAKPIQVQRTLEHQPE